MKPLRITDGVVPLGEFKSKASSLIKKLKEKSLTIIITQNGRPAAVMMAPEEYDRLQEQQSYLEAVAVGLGDAIDGRVIDHDKVRKWLSTWGTDREAEPPL